MPRPHARAPARHIGRRHVVAVGNPSQFGAMTLLAALMGGSLPAYPQSPTIAEVAAYQGPDRTQRLIAGAKKEKVVMVYGSTVAEDMRPVSDAFRKKYGIDFQYWRASSEQLVQRSVNENRAGRCAVDAFATVAAELETLHREKLLLAVKTPATTPSRRSAGARRSNRSISARWSRWATGRRCRAARRIRTPRSCSTIS